MMTTTKSNKVTKSLTSGSLALGAAVAASIAGSVLSAPSAQASTVFYTEPQIFIYPETLVPPGTTINFTLKGFDTSLGKLTSVHLKQIVNINAVFQVINGPRASAGGSFTNGSVSVPVGVTGPASTVNTTAVATVASGTTNPGVFQLTEFPGLIVTNTTELSEPENNFSKYLGDTVPLSFTTVFGPGQFSGTTSDNLFFGGEATVTGQFELYYDYTVPEPLTMLGAGTALAFGGFFKRKLAKNKK